MTLSPGYCYEKAPDQQHFLARSRDDEAVRRDPGQSQKELEIQSKPTIPGVSDGIEDLRLHSVGHAQLQPVRLAEAMLSAAGRILRDLRGTAGTRANGDSYGVESGNPRCANCMVHSGYEASAVNDTFGSLNGF